MLFSTSIVILTFSATLFANQLQIGSSADVTGSKEDVNLLEHDRTKGIDEDHSRARNFSAPLGLVLERVTSIFHEYLRFHEGSQGNSTSNTTRLIEVMDMTNEEKVLFQKSRETFEQITYSADIYHPSLKSMRIEFETYEEAYLGKFKVMANDIDSWIKESIVKKLVDLSSSIRADLRTFVERYRGISDPNILPSNVLYDSALKNSKEKAENNLDCFDQSDHARIFHAYFYITEIITKMYVMVAAAHTIRYQNKSTGDGGSKYWMNPIKDVFNDYVNTMNMIMTDTKSALAKTSREIRVCGPSDFIKKRTFDRLDFITTRLNISLDKNFDSLWKLSKGTIMGKDCHPSNFYETSLRKGNFTMFDCTDLAKGVYNLYIDQLNGTIHRVDYDGSSWYQRTRVDKTYGRSAEKFFKIITLHQLQTCRISTCYSYVERKAGFSMEPVEAQPGFVVTGIRWRIIENIVYIEIQQGKFIDATQVDTDTVVWTETPISNHSNIYYLEKESRSIILDDVLLSEKFYVTGVQFVIVRGKITLHLKSSRADHTGRKLLAENENDDASTKNIDTHMMKLNIDGSDDPEIAATIPSDMVVTKQGKYFVEFQPTDFEKDLGSTTIPYFDVQEVVTKPSAPISGIGIYHKAIPGNGGFIGFKMFSPDLKSFSDINAFNQYFNVTKLFPS